MVSIVIKQVPIRPGDSHAGTARDSGHVTSMFAQAFFQAQTACPAGTNLQGMSSDVLIIQVQYKIHRTFNYLKCSLMTSPRSAVTEPMAHRLWYLPTRFYPVC